MARSFRQFGLRTLLGVISITAAGLGLWRGLIEPVHRQHAAVTYLADLGGNAHWRAWGPSWLRNGLGSYYFTQVDALDLHRSRVTDDDLEVLAELPTVTRVYLSGTAVGRDGLKHLQKLPRLERLALWRTPVTDADLKPLAEIRTLRALDLQETKTTELCLADLSRLDRLETLKFHFSVSDAGLSDLVKLPELSLDDLTVVGVTSQKASLLAEIRTQYLEIRQPQGDGWAAHVADHPTVSALRLKDAELNEAELRAIIELNRLSALYLRNIPLTDALLPLLASCDRLEHAELRGTRTTPTEFLRHFGPQRQGVVILHDWIRLSGANSWPSIDWLGKLTDEDLNALQFCREAERLHISAGTLKAVGTKWLESMSKLQSIHITFPLDDDALRRLGNLPKLRYVEIAGEQPRLTPQGIAELGKASKLERLDLHHVGLTDAHLKEIGQVQQLKVLRVPGNPITDQGIAHLVTLDKLESLSISFCGQLGDEALRHIAQLPQLRDLSAQETQISDAGLQHLSQMLLLRNVSVLGSKHTKQGLREFRKNLPTPGGVIY